MNLIFPFSPVVCVSFPSFITVSKPVISPFSTFAFSSLNFAPSISACVWLSTFKIEKLLEPVISAPALKTIISFELLIAVFSTPSYHAVLDKVTAVSSAAFIVTLYLITTFSSSGTVNLYSLLFTSPVPIVNVHPDCARDSPFTVILSESRVIIFGIWSTTVIVSLSFKRFSPFGFTVNV